MAQSIALSKLKLPRGSEFVRRFGKISISNNEKKTYQMSKLIFNVSLIALDWAQFSEETIRRGKMNPF